MTRNGAKKRRYIPKASHHSPQSLTADAATSRIKILRTVDGKQVEIKNAKQTELIKPGDTVVVPVRFF